jgi:8-oxo-dGTP diphosphatase
MGTAMTDIVNALLFRDGVVLLARRSSGRTTYPNCWSFPGGHVEIGEPLSEALKREMQEELGLTPIAFRKIGTITELQTQTNNEILYHMYEISDWTGGEPDIADDEHSDIQWFSIESACALKDLAMTEYTAILRTLLR